MTMYNPVAEVHSFEALSQKVRAMGEFVERLPGRNMLRDLSPFAAISVEQPTATAEVTTTAADAQSQYDQGFADGYAQAEAAMRGQIADMQALLLEANALQIEPTAEIAQMICDLVERLVIPICEAMPVTRQWLLNQIDKAMPYVAECSEAQTLWLHPEDAALLADAVLPFEVQMDPSMPRASLQIRSSTGFLETGISPFIQQMRDALDLSEVA